MAADVLTPPTPALVAQARAALAGRDPALARAHAATPVFTWRLRTQGFAALLKLIVEQQVSVAAAAAIWARLEAGLGAGGVTPSSVLRGGPDVLRACGLSRGKAAYALAMAEAETRGPSRLAGLAELQDDAAAAVLMGLKGVGPWTAQTYLMFCEGRLDAFPAGDVALQQGLAMALGEASRPDATALMARAEAWRPYRGVAAHLLWAYYGAVRRGELQPATMNRA